MSYESFYCLSDKMQPLYRMRLTVRYEFTELANTCVKAHEKTLGDKIGNLTQPFFGFCMEYAGVGNIYISNMTSTTSSFTVSIHLPS